MARHPNGGGLIRGDARASPCAYIDRRSVVRDRARVFGGEIFNSRITGSTVIAGNPRVESSVLDCESVSDSAVVEDVTLAGAITVSGDAVLIGPFSISSGYGVNIHTGVWTRPPRSIKFARYAVSECSAGRAHVGCRCRSVADWLSRGRELARRMGFSAAETKELESVFLSWSSTPSPSYKSP